jgi:hypothetical protein
MHKRSVVAVLRGYSAEWGRLAEQAIRKQYLETGWYVVPTHAIETGGAPMLIGLIKKFVLPDFQMFKPQAAPCWVECKYKDHLDRFQKLSQWQQGIDLPNWYAYLEVERVTGIAGRLAILQYRPGREAEPKPVHLWQSFERLKKWVQIKTTPHHKFPKGAAYWPVDAFKCSPITFRPPEDLPTVSENLNPWEKKSKVGVAPQWPIKYCNESPFERYGGLNLSDLPLFAMGDA